MCKVLLGKKKTFNYIEKPCLLTKLFSKKNFFLKIGKICQEKKIKKITALPSNSTRA